MIMGIFGRHTVETAHDHEKPPCEVRIIAPSANCDAEVAGGMDVLDGSRPVRARGDARSAGGKPLAR
jgi:hypothetical protein